ncbi:MAG: chitin deacetylase family protein [Gemmatimonadaceae bacterium]
MRRTKVLVAITSAIVLAAAAGTAILRHPYPIVVRLKRRYPDVLFLVDTRKRIVALTIDDGPNAETTDSILEVLASYSAHATFFVIGSRIRGNEGTVRRIVADGNELGNHLFTDRPSVRLSKDEFEQELLRTDQLISAFGQAKWFRPGAGMFSQQMISTAHAHGYRCVLGSVYPFDPHIPSGWYIRHVIRRAVHPGAIIILHDGPGRGPRTADVLREVLPELRARGYRVTTVSELWPAGLATIRARKQITERSCQQAHPEGARSASQSSSPAR